MLAVWMGTQADEAFPEAWHSDAASVHGEGVFNIRSNVYVSPKLCYLRVNVIEAQDVHPNDRSRLFKNLSLHSQVDDLQDQLSKLNVRLQACNLLDSVNNLDVIAEENDLYPNKRLKVFALLVSLLSLSIPLLIYIYIDYVSKSLRSADNVLEEVSLNKQLEYRVDVFLSLHPYAKPLALLVATLLLICLGGLALFGVTDDSLAHCLWLSWTYVADAGNHTNSEGIGPRLVSVSISFGGMLIFAMMLGLVSDAISEKFDSLRKGKSEVVEKTYPDSWLE